MLAARPRRLSGSPARGPAAGIAGCLDALGALLSFGFGGAAFYGEPGQRPSSHSIKARWLAGALRVAHLALCWRGCLCRAGGTLIPQAGRSPPGDESLSAGRQPRTRSTITYST